VLGQSGRGVASRTDNCLERGRGAEECESADDQNRPDEQAFIAQARKAVE